MKGWPSIAASAALAPATGGMALGAMPHASAVRVHPAHIFATMTRSALESVVSSSKTLTPGSSVNVLPQMSDRVEKVHEDFNNRVGKCQVLVALSTDMRKLQEQESQGSKVKGKMAKTHGKLDASGDMFSEEQQVNDLYHRTMDVLLAEESFTPPQFIALSRLREIDRACKMSELASLIFTSPTVMTGIVDRLVNLGMMKRNFDDRDRRVVLLTITELGKSAISSIHERLRDMAKRFSGCISASDREASVRVRRKYTEFLTEELRSLEAK